MVLSSLELWGENTHTSSHTCTHIHRVAVTGAKYKTTTFGHLHPLSASVFPLLPLRTLPDCSSWISSLCCYLGDPLLCLLLLLCLSPPCLSGDAQHRMMIITENTCPAKLLPLGPLPSCFLLGKRGNPTKQPKSLKTQKEKKNTFCQGLFCLGRKGSNLQLVGWEPKQGMGWGELGVVVDKDLRSLSRSDSFLLLCCTHSVPLLCPFSFLHVLPIQNSKDRALNLGKQVLSLSPVFTDV